MTQEQAQELLANVNGKIEMKRLDAVNLLIREIDELKMMEEDAQQYALKCRKELEALQSRSCAKCKAFKLDDEHNDGFGQCFFGINFPNGNSSSYHKGTDFYCSEFEAKEQ